MIIYYIFTLQSVTNQAIQNYKLINTLIQIKITHNTKTLKTRYKVNKTSYASNIKVCFALFSVC